MSLVAIDARDAVGAQLRGWGRYAQCLIEALRAHGPYGLEMEPLTTASRGPEVLFEQVGLPLWLRRRGAQLIHATNCFLPLVRPCPGVVTIHDLAFEVWREDFSIRTGAKYRFLAPRAARSAELVIVPSAFTRDELCTRYAIDAGKVRVIPEAPALRMAGAAPPGGRYVLAVGDLRIKKNLGALVRAFTSLWREGPAREHRLILAGCDSGEGAELRRLAGEAPVALTGYVADEELDALITGADVLVHPGPYEGFGLVVLEAMARGTPVLAAGAGALPETGGDAAAYFDPEDPDALTGAVAHLLEDAGWRDRLAALGRARAAEFSWERTARETAAAYRELV